MQCGVEQIPARVDLHAPLSDQRFGPLRHQHWAHARADAGAHAHADAVAADRCEGALGVPLVDASA